MPSSSSGRYISTPAYQRAPTNWLLQRGFITTGHAVSRPDPPPGQIRIPHLYASITHYTQHIQNGGTDHPGYPVETHGDEVIGIPEPPTPPETQFYQPMVTAATGLVATPSGYTYAGNGGFSGQMAGKKKIVPDKRDDEKIYNIPLIDLFRSKFKGTIKKGEIGLEIECEGVNLVQGMIDFWLVHPDNSLRPHKGHPPQEYVLREPIDRKEVPKALKYLNRKLEESGSELVYSHRTSVHVHLNCQRLTVKEIYQIWCLYTVFEEMLIEFSGPDRPGNLFCLSSKQAEYQVKVLEDAIRMEDFNTLFNDNLRYTSCNMASLGKFGSIEFRSMRGSVDMTLVQLWIDILTRLKDKALEFSDPQEIVKSFQTLGPDGFMNKVFGDRSDITDIFRSLSDRQKKMWDGLRLMRDVAHAIPVWEAQKLSPKKEYKKMAGRTKTGITLDDWS